MTKSIKLARNEIRDFIFSRRTIILIYSFIILTEDITERMKTVSKETGMKIGRTESFLLIVTDIRLSVVMPLVFAVILSDFPRQNGGQTFSILRLGRRKWFLGQIIYASGAALFYQLMMLFGSMIWLGKSGILTGSWSSYMTELYEFYPEVYLGNNHLFIPENVVTQGKPTIVLLHSIGLLTLYMVLMVQIISLFYFLGKRYVGVVVSIIIVFLGRASIGYDRIKWVFPMAHTLYGEHFHTFYSGTECELYFSYGYFVVLNIILFLINLVLCQDLVQIKMGDFSS